MVVTADRRPAADQARPCYTTSASFLRAPRRRQDVAGILVAMAVTDAPPKFAADRTLMRLARWLRLMGADVLCEPHARAVEMLAMARRHGRPLLTRDKGLRAARDVLYVENHHIRDQLREVIAHYPFDPLAFAFTRCSRCNALLHEVARDAMLVRLPPFVYASHEKFAVCDGCGQVYWNSTHPERARREIAAALNVPTSRAHESAMCIKPAGR